MINKLLFGQTPKLKGSITKPKSELKACIQNLVASGWSIHDCSNSIKNFKADIFTFFITVQP